MRSASLQYANVLADIALEQGAAEPAAKQLSAFGAAYAESAELRTFLASPAVTVEGKHAVIEKIIEKKELAATLARLTGKKIETRYSLDPALLGGAVVRIGDTIYDGSLRSRLNEMRARLAAE